MRTHCSVALTVAVTMAMAALAAEARTVIVVNRGSFPSPGAAARAEAAIDWTDGNPADDTIVTECFAATQLQHYLRRMFGRGDDFAIADDGAAPGDGDFVLVGGPASNAATRQLAKPLRIEGKGLEALGPEGYRILSSVADGRRITVVAGGGRVGTLYATYDLLYRLGCRWFAPGELHEEVPRVESIPDLDVTEQPAFLMRGFLAWEDRGNPEFFLWMARNRLNEWCVEQSDHPRLHKLGIRLVGGLHDAEERFLNPPSPYPYRHPRFPEGESGRPVPPGGKPPDAGKPLDPYPVSSQYQGDANRDGKLNYFEAHPEWFPMVKGRRVPGIEGWFGTNFCTSNPDATSEFMKNFLHAIVEGPYRDAEVIRFWTLDAGRWCECPQCKALGTPTDRNLLLVWRLDREIKKARAQGKIHRPILIRFLAYADVLEPPTRRLPTDFDYATCWATYYPIARCYVHEFDDPACAVNARYLSQLRGWATDPGRHYRGQLQLGEYYNVSGYKCLPINFARTMAHDIPCYYRLGARQFEYMHVTTGRWGTKALTNYQMARQLWNVDTNCQALWSDYFAKRYGPAAEPMRSLYGSLERMLANVTEIKYGLARRLNQGSDDLFPTSHLRFERTAGIACDGPAWTEIVDQSRACRLVLDGVLTSKVPDRVRARVAEDERTFAYAERTMAYYDACVQAFQALRAKRLEEARSHCARAKELAASLAEDKLSASMSASHANAANAFEATLAQGALARLAQAIDPAKRGLLGHWRLSGDCRDDSGEGNHGTSRHVTFTAGPNGAALFNGRDSAIVVPDAKSLHLGTGDFSISAWVKPEAPMRGVFGDLVSKFDARRRRGVNFHIAGSSPGYNAMCDTRHVHFGIDDGYLGKWEDCGKPWASNSLVTCLVVFEGDLYCGIADAENPKDAARVFRWAGGTKWTDCGRLGNDPRHLSVQSMIVHRGKLYAGTGIYDWDRARGRSQGLPPAAKTRVFVYEGGAKWRDLGQVGEASRVLSMASFNGELYVGLDADPGGGKCFKFADSRWIDCGAPDGANVQNLLPLAGTLYAATHGRVHRYEGGQKWTCICDRLFEINQTHCLDAFCGKLHAGTWPQGYVLRHEGGQNWINTGRLGLPAGRPECNEVNDLVVYNGKLYAGVIPRAEVYRYEADGQWTLLGSLARHPRWARGNLESWCRLTAFTSFQGRLFACTGACKGRALDAEADGSLGRVYAIRAGLVVSHEHDLGAGWTHLAAVRRGREVQLYVNGRLSASAQGPEGSRFDLSNTEPLSIGFGPQTYFSGAMADLRLYGRALDAEEIHRIQGQRGR